MDRLGWERFEPLGGNRYGTVFSMGGGTVERRDLNRPASYSMLIEGQASGASNDLLSPS